MKVLIGFAVFLVLQGCSATTHPSVWNREQRNRETANVSLVNTDRLMAVVETRILNAVRSETAAIKLQLSSLEHAVRAVKSDVAGLKTSFDALRDDVNPDQDLGKLEQPEARNNGLAKKLDAVYALLGTVRGTINKIEKDIVTVKKNSRSSHGVVRQNQPIALLHPNANAEVNGVCSVNDPNTATGLRKIRGNFFAFCDMETDEGSGWIVIQNRFDGTTDFFRTWNEYKDGFGNLAGEFWLGLGKIHELTSSHIHELLIVMEDFSGTKKYAKYAAFGIAGESSNYALNMLGKFMGDAGDSMSYHAGMKFSTLDNDNDAWTDGNCARSHFGGWWYNSCDESNLNGRYFLDGSVESAQNYHGIYWGAFTGSMSSLKSVKMMIRPVD